MPCTPFWRFRLSRTCYDRGLRGKASAPLLRLAQMSWSDVLKSRLIQLAETAKSDGNVRLSELAVLTLAAFDAPTGSEIIEIGTFDGRTALNLAINAPPGRRALAQLWQALAGRCRLRRAIVRGFRHIRLVAVLLAVGIGLCRRLPCL